MTVIDKTAASLGAAALHTAMSLRAMKTRVEAENAVRMVVHDNVKAAIRMAGPKPDPKPDHKPDPAPERRLDRTV